MFALVMGAHHASILGLAVALPFAAFAALAASGCSREEGGDGHDRMKSGEALYAEMCKNCHGARGEGGKGPALRDIDKKYEEPALARFIDDRMPLGEPDRCNGDCPIDIAAYIHRAFRGPIVCDAPVPLARGIRLLTRREYKATIEDLFGPLPKTGGPSTTTSCGPQTFTYDPQGRTLSTVHVAGTFNNWAGTIAAGGWALANNGGVWKLTQQVPNGSHQYKLVLNESEWITDLANPKTAPDGLGGQNSVLDVTCTPGTGGTGGAAAGLDPTLSFPPDTRPEGFAFDDHGPGRVVTSVVMDEHVRAANAIAAAVDLGKVVTCDRTQRDTCAPAFVRDLGKRIFRRPLSDAEVARFAGVVIGAPDFDKGARGAIRAMLASPSFVYRTEVGQRQPDGSYRLDRWEIASALSYFFTGSMPDAALFAAADSGALDTPDGIEKEARRLLASPRARTMVATFAEQWLGAENVTSVTKADASFDALRAAMLEETRRFVTHVVFDGTHAAGELFTADYTFANETLAKHYGIGGVTGAELRIVKYPDRMRSGLLGHGSVLATTAHSDQSSPIRRGLFVRRRLLCQEFAPPPPNAGGVPKVDPNATTRERFAQHTANAQCKSCHQYIDDVGFGFERFGETGKLRDSEAGKPIDAHGDMNDVEGFGKGTHAPFDDLASLGQTLASSEAAKACIVRQTWRFARGQVGDDVCQVASIERRFAEKGGDLRELLIAIATDPAFTTRR